MERKTQQLSNLANKSQVYKGQALKDPLYTEVLEIRRKFLETGVYRGDSWTWVLINDYIACKEEGWPMKKQVGKIREAIIKYGEDSTFWSEWYSTRALRNLQAHRLANLLREAQKMLKEGGLSRPLRKELGFAQVVGLDIRKKLLLNPLTEKQMKIIWRVERLTGIYYNDLSPEENGEIWKVTEMEKCEYEEECDE